MGSVLFSFPTSFKRSIQIKHFNHVSKWLVSLVASIIEDGGKKQEILVYCKCTRHI